MVPSSSISHINYIGFPVESCYMRCTLRLYISITMQCLLVAPLMMVLFLFSVDRHDGAFGRSYDRALSLLAKANVLRRQLPYTGKTFLSRQLSYTRSLSLLGAVKRRTTQMVANGRIPQGLSYDVFCFL